MTLKQIGLLIVFTTPYSCSLNNQAVNPQQAERLLPSREESVGFLSLIHKKIRETEQATYDLMYGIRDGADSFVYDVQKDYYDSYQK